MPDPLTVLGLTVVSKPLLLKILGPTADYIGGELREFTKRRVDNINAVFSNAAGKLGAKLETPGQVPPRVLKVIINDASYAEDTVSVEYFGGVLASARTPNGRDDRGARIAKIIDGLSSYQVRTHYLVYSAVAELFRGGDDSFQHTQGRSKMEFFVSFHGYFSAMQLSPAEANGQFLDHVLHGLSNEGLVEDHWSYGTKDFLQKQNKNSPGDGIICIPTAFGAEMLLWAFGHGDKPLDFLLTNNFSTSIDGIPTLGSEAIPMKSR